MVSRGIYIHQLTRGADPLRIPFELIRTIEVVRIIRGIGCRVHQLGCQSVQRHLVAFRRQ